MKIKGYPTQEKIKELFRYENGNLIWRTNRHARKVKDKIAGWTDKQKYMYISISHITYFAHRIIWIYFNGDIPEGLEIDHIDRNPNNNKIGNLRLVTHSKNQQNSLYKGCCYHKATGKFQATITANKKRIYLGLYIKEQDAMDVYSKAKQIYHII